MSVTVYGASDDLIEVEGDVREEFPWYPADGDALLGFSNGVVVRVTLGDVWRIAPVAGSDRVQIQQCPENDEDNYSDRATIDGRVAWVVCGSAWAGVPSKTSDDRSARGQYVPLDATVEVLERADDPSNDLAGVLRREEHDGAFVLYAKGADAGTAWVVVSSSALQMLGRRFDDQFVAEFPRAGVVPGTPAAEAARREQVYPDVSGGGVPYPPLHVDNEAIVMGQYYGKHDREPARRSVRVENTPGPPADVRAKIRRHIEDGDEETAVVVAQNAGIADARSYVEATWEYLSQRSRTEVDAVEADRMRAMGFDRQPEFKVSDEDRASIQAVLDERANEYVYGGAHGWKLDSSALTGVVADIVWAAIRRDRERGDR